MIDSITMKEGVSSVTLNLVMAELRNTVCLTDDLCWIILMADVCNTGTYIKVKDVFRFSSSLHAFTTRFWLTLQHHLVSEFIQRLTHEWSNCNANQTIKLTHYKQYQGQKSETEKKLTWTKKKKKFGMKINYLFKIKN